ncbi:Na+/H+ antiporter NhaC [Robertmurraya andreesenii]|uniref:NhaC family Na+:H+ antiporter n=1 Tax=Anoxybacillus andreesenii TaxID=1325932 RepID=A0ABT9UZH0_9BACL|nr:Na+/H+ antiporter NhaC [Robertmurraya andreesenii]MDQ0154068.1 NhaC family Na+:H+ antiporter [Robertmurraya andreesenii]
MRQEQAIIKLTFLEAILLTLLILGGVSFLIIKYEAVPHIPIVLAIFLLFLYGMIKKVSIKDLESGMIEGAKSGLGAVMIFFFIGMLISSWMASGTIPTFIYFALEFVNGKFFYCVVFVVTSLIGISIGSSLTTAATLGVAFMSVSSALDFSLPITAGAIISGAFFGDKMSPISDTTNLASMTVKVDLFEHIKNMMWTTVPAFLLSFVLFAALSPAEASASFEKISLLKETLRSLNLVHLYSILPFLVLTFLAIKRVSSIVTLSAGILSSLVLTFFVQENFNFAVMIKLLFSGFEIKSGVEEIDVLLGRGGMESMMFSMSLVLLALALGGLLFKIGIMDALLNAISAFLYKVPLLVLSTVTTAIGINFLVGEQYLSILLTGNAFEQPFKKAGLHLKNLSRILEDAGTVINPLVPWGVCGVFLSGVLGVDTIDYVPYAFFCLLSPIITLFFGFTGIRISKL